MFERLKRLFAYRVNLSITIVTPPPVGVKHTAEPRILEKEAPRIYRKNHSNLRFVEEVITEKDGVEKFWYFTEEYKDGVWGLVGNFHRERTSAMAQHLEILESGVYVPGKIRNVLWEGLSKDEAETWVAVSGE